MAIDKYIPRLEWNQITGLTGTLVINTPNITLISSTAALRVGMIVQGVGIPSGTRIVSKTLTSVVMSQNATASGSAVSLTFFERYDFEYPPVKDSEEKLKPAQKISTSINGSTQVQTDHLEAERELDFGFVKSEDADLLATIFYQSFALFGNSFRYFQDKEDAAFQNYELNTFTFNKNRQVKKHPLFLYQLKFSFRRVVL